LPEQLAGAFKAAACDASASGAVLAGFFLAIFSARFRATLGDQLVAE
jgi:hypothetical protein